MHARVGVNAAQIMTLELRCIDEDTPIDVAWNQMQHMRVRHLPVVEGKRLVGMLSDRDLLQRATRGIDGKLRFPDLCAAEAMTFHPKTARPDASVAALAAQMVEGHIDAIPIVSPGGELLGLVTSADLLMLIAAGDFGAPLGA